jgi:hypothetical protein
MTHRVQFSKSGAPLDGRAIDALEELVGARLPPAYRSFLERQNGGIPTPYEMRAGKTWVGVQAFLSAGPPHDIATFFRLLCPAGQRRVPPELIPIARCEGGNFLCLGVEGTFLGRVYLWDHEEEGVDSYTYANLTELSPDLDDFLARLQ